MKRLTPDQLIKEIVAGGDCPGCILFVSPDLVRKERFLAETLKGQFKGIASSDALQRIDCAGLSAEGMRRFRMELSSLSLFSPKRCFYLRNADSLSTPLTKALLEAVKDVPPTSKVLITASKLQQANVLYKWAKSEGVLIERDELQGEQLHKWLNRILNEAGVKNYPPKLLDALAQHSDGDLDRATGLAQRVALLADRETLTVDDLGPILDLREEFSAFALIDAVGEKDLGKSQKILEHLMRMGREPFEPFSLLSLIARQFTNYARIREGLELGKRPDEIKEDLGIRGRMEWVFTKQLSAAKKRSLPEVMTSLILIFQADTKLKNKSLGTEAIFSELVQRLAC